MSAAIDGYNAANESEPSVDPMTEVEFDRMIEDNSEWIVASGSSAVQ